jgi:hypothetical protein
MLTYPMTTGHTCDDSNLGSPGGKEPLRLLVARSGSIQPRVLFKNAATHSLLADLWGDIEVTYRGD